MAGLLSLCRFATLRRGVFALNPFAPIVHPKPNTGKEFTPAQKPFAVLSSPGGEETGEGGRQNNLFNLPKPKMAARCPTQTALAGCEGMSVTHSRTRPMTFVNGNREWLARPYCC